MGTFMGYLFRNRTEHSRLILQHSDHSGGEASYRRFGRGRHEEVAQHFTGLIHGFLREGIRQCARSDSSNDGRGSHAIRSELQWYLREWNGELPSDGEEIVFQGKIDEQEVYQCVGAAQKAVITEIMTHLMNDDISTGYTKASFFGREDSSLLWRVMMKHAYKRCFLQSRSYRIEQWKNNHNSRWKTLTDTWHQDDEKLGPARHSPKSPPERDGFQTRTESEDLHPIKVGPVRVSLKARCWSNRLVLIETVNALLRYFRSRKRLAAGSSENIQLGSLVSVMYQARQLMWTSQWFTFLIDPQMFIIKLSHKWSSALSVQWWIPGPRTLNCSEDQ